MNRALLALIGCILLFVPVAPAFVIAAIACSLFVDRSRDSAAVVGIILVCAGVEALSGRMFGVLSLPFAMVASAVILSDRFVSFTQGYVRSVMTASVMTMVMTALSVLVTTYLYGRGMVAVRLAIAVPHYAWWATPVLCAAMLAWCTSPWRGTDLEPMA